MKIDTLKKRLNAEFDFSEVYDYLETDSFNPGTILLTPNLKERQRPWMEKAYDEWMKGDRTIVLVAQQKSCIYFKKYLGDVAEIRQIKETMTYNNNRVMNPMIIAIYWKRPSDQPNFTVSFD